MKYILLSETELDIMQLLWKEQNGKLQKRLWSITYQVWLTDWIDVE